MKSSPLSTLQTSVSCQCPTPLSLPIKKYNENSAPQLVFRRFDGFGDPRILRKVDELRVKIQLCRRYLS